ncbi:NAD(P)/FAD-dependent oxidoreductase [Saccharothrix deserti]|uniref:NAD(P)/FAD-dependent oxidoreductase n=1 Tax=Saccharothrix deserti TaxID=2593674 RepID=UPI00131C9A84|nr:FAD-dependent oxidoreductase [Saccharothrix deserti]
MSNVVVAGGGIAGLAAALALAGHGRRVVVLERGAAPPDGPPGSAGQSWPRPTVPSWPHAHTLTSLGVSVLLDRAPEVLAAALDAGAVVVDLTRAKPPEPSGVEPGDAELLALACRRPTLETVLYRIVRDLPDVEIRHGVRVDGLVLDTGRDRVTGVVTDGGERIAAGLVLDATGRRALGRSWLAKHGITVRPDLTSPSNMRIFSRFYRRLGQPSTLNRGHAAGVLGDHYAGVLHPGDSDTFSISLGILPEDRTMRVLRDPAAFTAVALATPGVAEWLAPGMSTPITGVRAINCAPNAVRTLAVAPPVAGLVPVGDAAAITNPLYGRGVSLAFAHAFRLGDLLTVEGVGSPVQRDATSRLAAELVLPWFRLARADDAERVAHWRAAVHGWAPPPRPRELTMRTIARVADRDAVVWRGLLRVLMGLSQPDTVLGDAALADRVRGLLADHVPRGRAPSRTDLLAAVARETRQAS